MAKSFKNHLRTSYNFISYLYRHCTSKANIFSKRNRHYVLAVVVGCLTGKDLETARCDALCKRDGYSSGYFQNSCNCVDKKGSVEDLIKRRTSVDQSQQPQEKPSNNGRISVYLPRSQYDLNENE